MALTLTQVTANTATVTITGGVIGDASLTVVYRPSLVTEKVVAQLQAFSDVERSAAHLIETFSTLNEILAGKPGDPPEPGLIKAWDFYEDDAQTQLVPITPARLAALPLMLRTQLVAAILKDMRPEDQAAQ